MTTDDTSNSARPYRLVGEGRVIGAAPTDVSTQGARSIYAAWDELSAVPEAAARLTGLEVLHAIRTGKLPGAPVLHLLDIRQVEAEHGRVVFEMMPHEAHYNPMGVVHGGVLSTILDSALGCAVLSTLPANSAYTTVDLHVTMVRAVTAETGLVRAEAHVLHRGRTIATADAKLTDRAGNLLAHGLTTCQIRQRA